MRGVLKNVIDKDGEDYVIYQIKLKQYISDLSKYTDSLEKCFSEIMGQCSPGMEQALEGEGTYASIEAISDSIGLIKMLERICYNYQSHEYPPLGAWESMDRLCNLKQPEFVSESDHHENFKTMVEVCKANGINFALLFSHNIDAAMK